MPLPFLRGLGQRRFVELLAILKRHRGDIPVNHLQRLPPAQVLDRHGVHSRFSEQTGESAAEGVRVAG
jgi:hypothetical protein